MRSLVVLVKFLLLIAIVLGFVILIVQVFPYFKMFVSAVIKALQKATSFLGRI